MFPQSLRFDVRHEKNFFKEASRKNFSLFQIFWIEPADQVQFAVVVPKKVSKKATERHKILRRMRSLLTSYSHHFPQKKIVFVMSWKSLGKSYLELEAEVKKVVGDKK